MKHATTLALVTMVLIGAYAKWHYVTRLETLESLMLHSIHLPKEHWVCTDVLRDGDGMVECARWENIK
jgi:hypothetical protein